MNPNFPQISLDLNEPETETKEDNTMNDIISINPNQPLTMSSQEIAELCVKRHDNVLRDIRAMLISLYGEEHAAAGLPEQDVFECVLAHFGDSSKLRNEQIQGLRVERDNRGFISSISLDYNHTMTLIAGYNVKLRKAIIDRWQELEEQIKAPALNPANLSRLQLIEMAMQAEQERLALEHKVGELTPKADALDRIALADGNHNLTVSAKIIDVSLRKMIDSLHANKWIYHRAGGKGNLAYQDKIQKGWLTHKITTVQREDGSEKIVEQVLVTPKGLTVLARLLGKTGLLETVPEAV